MKDIPAFPRPFSKDAWQNVQKGYEESEAYGGQDGMTLRDYFAGQEMVNCNFPGPGDIAEHCYQVADAMLKEREK